MLGIFVNFSIVICFDGVLPVYVKRKFCWNSPGTALIFMSTAFPQVTTPLMGRISDTYGAYWLTLSGFTPTTPCLSAKDNHR